MKKQKLKSALNKFAKWLLVKALPVIVIMAMLMWLFNAKFDSAELTDVVVIFNPSLFFVTMFIMVAILLGLGMRQSEEQDYENSKDMQSKNIERWAKVFEINMRADNKEKALYILDDLDRSVKATRSKLMDELGIDNDNPLPYDNCVFSQCPTPATCAAEKQCVCPCRGDAADDQNKYLGEKS